jgi:hypothetical protein
MPIGNGVLITAPPPNGKEHSGKSTAPEGGFPESLWSTETLEMATSEKEKLRGRDRGQVKDQELQQHLADVNMATTKLADFVSELRRAAP